MATSELDRIARMEYYLDEIAVLTAKLQEQLDAMKAAESHAKALFSYYGSEDWKQDFTDDEAGRLPASLKRGVLSEDGIWNLLEAHRELQEKIRNITR